ncbi:hypothetical protein, partial [Helicobacter salomonis]|uniref:hypothetical protein n=1 Tax=Helicobacter salomonis TaxID=56878 RepID=UPI0013156F91
MQRDLLTNLGSDTKLATDAFFKEQERVLQYQFQERLQAFEHSLEQAKAQVIQAHLAQIQQALQQSNQALQESLQAQLEPQMLSSLEKHLHTLSQQAQTTLSAALAAQQTEFKGAIQEFITELETHYSAIIEQDFRGAIEQAIKQMDLSFLQAQHGSFYQQTRKNLEVLFKREFNQENLHQLKGVVLEILQEGMPLRALREMQLEAQIHLQSLIQTHALKILQEQSVALMEHTQAQMRFYTQVELER